MGFHMIFYQFMSVVQARPRAVGGRLPSARGRWWSVSRSVVQARPRADRGRLPSARGRWFYFFVKKSEKFISIQKNMLVLKKLFKGIEKFCGLSYDF